MFDLRLYRLLGKIQRSLLHTTIKFVDREISRNMHTPLSSNKDNILCDILSAEEDKMFMTYFTEYMKYFDASFNWDKFVTSFHWNNAHNFHWR